jgi:hypothetical protein
MRRIPVACVTAVQLRVIMSLMSLVFMAVRALIYGFIGAALAYSVLRNAFRFRAEWSKVLPAAWLANFVLAISEMAVVGYFDREDPDFFIKYLGLLAGIALISGILASRLSVKSESGRTLSWLSAVVGGACTVAPALVIGILVVGAIGAME